MHDIDDRLTAAARSAAERAGLPDAPVIRDHGRRIVRRRRAARGGGVLSLIVALVAGIGFAGGFGIGGRAAPVAPATGGGATTEAPDTSKAEVRMPAPTVTEKRGSIELRGKASGTETWRFGVRTSPEGVCAEHEVMPLGASGSSCSDREAVVGDTLGIVEPSCSGEVSDFFTGTGDDQEDGEGHYGTMFTGLVSPDAALVRVELLDGRALELEPVPSKELGAGLVAGYLPECVLHAYTFALDAEGKVVSVHGSNTGGLSRLGDVAPSPSRDPQGQLRFAAGVTPERRREILLAIEARGAELVGVDGDRYG